MNMFSGQLMNTWIDSLQAFFPGLQVGGRFHVRGLAGCFGEVQRAACPCCALSEVAVLPVLGRDRPDPAGGAAATVLGCGPPGFGLCWLNHGAGPVCTAPVSLALMGWKPGPLVVRVVSWGVLSVSGLSLWVTCVA